MSFATKCSITNDGLYYLDYKTHEIYHFDFNGKYINKIGNVGHGASEYVDIKDFFIDNKNGNVKVLSSNGIVNYDAKTGKFVSRESIKSDIFTDASSFVYSNNTYTFFCPTYDYTIMEYKNKEFYNLRKSHGFQLACNRFFLTGEQINVIADYGDFYIDKLSANHLIRKYNIDLCGKELPKNKKTKDMGQFDKIDSSPSYFKCITEALESNKWLYLQVVGPKQTYYQMFINKENKKYYAGAVDTNAGLTFVASYNNHFYALVYPELVSKNSFVRKYIKEKKQSGNPFLFEIDIK